MIIGVGGFSSDAGKTTLMCELISAFPAWEAIKITRGHYRSCGKDPHACCVSHLLKDEPVIRSGKSETYAPGKDTGRYWDAGASNVHWVIVTDKQIEDGTQQALARVEAPGVLIEGNSFLRYIDADFTLMAARADGGKIKPSARRALAKTNALYLFDDEESVLNHSLRERFAAWRDNFADKDLIRDLPIYTRRDLPHLVAHLRALHVSLAA
jgi:molybdopterin-guanine dinucleotide biosynthesis protein